MRIGEKVKERNILHAGKIGRFERFSHQDEKMAIITVSMNDEGYQPQILVKVENLSRYVYGVFRVHKFFPGLSKELLNLYPIKELAEEKKKIYEETKSAPKYDYADNPIFHSYEVKEIELENE